MTPHPKTTLIGIGLMLFAMAVLPGIDVIAKYMGQNGMPVLQIVWARLTFGALVTLPFALPQTGVRGLVPNRPLYHGLRASLLISATFLFFWSLKFLPIADALAIFFVQPLVVTALSPLVLGEHVGPRRWAAVAVGFIGTLIIIRPGFGVLNPGSLLASGLGHLPCALLPDDPPHCRRAKGHHHHVSHQPSWRRDHHRPRSAGLDHAQPDRMAAVSWRWPPSPTSGTTASCAPMTTPRRPFSPPSPIPR